MIISASRRTDIPSLHTKWFINRLKEGYIITQNPINKNNFYKITLNKNIVDIIVFWSKNPDIEFLNEVKDLGYEFYLHFTITAYDENIEKNIPDKYSLIKKFQSISKLFAKEKIVWRYDPIILNDDFDINYHINHFKNFAYSLNGYTDECIFSFVEIYSKIKNSIKNINNDDKVLLIENMKYISEKNNIKLKSCSQDFDNSNIKIEKSACIDKERIQKILGYSIKEKKDKSQRKLCACIESIDIGMYNTCTNGCIYCYANSKNILKDYDANSKILSDKYLNDNINIKERKIIVNEKSKVFKL
ncbi:hypothetical protein A966_03685 [Brachyspira hampsonii 30446]|uniref:DUF1848 domain-containing protein n=1 Tax=Brachyspira hampsonii 30446 TaxID=1289135 RepID=A0A2U4FR00_9SPIR|nr:DUF1848 domain-containing protein [Brachyspira hampsonii]EKV57663.1 hypothetical protein A966_03685 [Brachyspira hampsonii 30446]MBW5395136.1 DUF1848 domain-containing protein [Brachyspira hampsonii]